MNRRDFIVDTGVALAAVLPGSKTFAQFVAAKSSVAGNFVREGTEASEHLNNKNDDRTYHVLGVPLRSGSLYPGNENDAQPYREARLLARLQAAGCKAVDDGDVAIPSYLPHHSIPPIRSWPAPRIAWECVSERIAPFLKQSGHVPLLIGCDCSVVVGTTQALKTVSREDVHVIYLDGDFDDAPPDPALCQSAAAMGMWLLTHDSPFWAGPPLRPQQATVIGWSNPSRSNQAGIGSVSLVEVRRLGPAEAARKTLAAIPASASIVFHFDVDVFQKKEMAAAYFPHAEGLTLSEGAELLGVVLKDPRIRVIEISEYAALRDLDQQWVNKLVDLLAAGMKR